MTDLIEVHTAHLAGEPLAWAVGRAESLDVLLAPPIYGNPWRVLTTNLPPPAAWRPCSPPRRRHGPAQSVITSWPEEAIWHS